MRFTTFLTLTNDEMRRRAPSIFTEGKSERTSDKYQQISTSKVIEGLAEEGFLPVWVAQSRSRLAEKKAYTKHMLRFRHVNARPTASGLFPELVLINSHDGLSSYRLLSGVFRMVCSNGLIAGNTYEQIRIRHQGDIIGNVIEGTYSIIENSQKMLNASEEMSTIKLDSQEAKIFAEAAHLIRFEGHETGKGINPLSLLTPRRMAEINKNDLFTIFNVIQENVIKGGVRGYAKDRFGRFTKRIHTRAIKSIDQNTTLNRALWTLTEKMHQLRSI